MGKKRVKSRSKGHSLLWDYYMFNRQSRQENRQKQEHGNREKEQKQAVQSERLYMIIIIAGLAGIVVKYFII